MRTRDWRCWIVATLFVVALTPCSAAPFCVKPDARNFVVAAAEGDLTAPGWGGVWLLHGVDSKNTIHLHHCSADRSKNCFYATDVKPGRYYFKQAFPEGWNHLDYPVTTAKIWFQITGSGVDYIGHWAIQRQGQAVSNLDVSYHSDELDEMLSLCKIYKRTIYVDRINSDAVELGE